MDLIIDSTPHAYHYRNACNELKAGMNVIVVKPMSNDLNNAKEMVQEARKLGRKIVVAQQLRYHPPILKLKELLSQGTIGDIAYISLDAYFTREGPVRPKWIQPYPVLVEAGIHHVDLVESVGKPTFILYSRDKQL